MPNRNYLAGRRKEYKICTQLKKKGYDIVQRSAGSHSPIDIWAIHKKKREILLVQSKPDNFRLKQEEIIIKQNISLNGRFEVRFEVR